MSNTTTIQKYIPYGRQEITQADLDAVATALQSDYLTQGPRIQEFEEALAKKMGAKYAVVFNSATSALHGGCFVLGLGEGDEVITTPNTFVATSNAALYVGATPVFADIEADTGNIDTTKIEALITPNTKLLIPVHFAGHPVDLESIRVIADKYNLAVMEDACHAPGANYKDTKIGDCTYSDMVTLSFHPVKHIAAGEGGAVLTNRADLYEKLLMFRTHGITKKNMQREDVGDWYFEMQVLGYNYRLTDMQAALGLSQLKRLEESVAKRRKIADYYFEAFAGNSYFDLPPEREYATNAYHLFPIRLKNPLNKHKKEIFEALRANGIGVQTHYIPAYTHPYYQELDYPMGLCPVCEDFYEREISIPMYPSLSKNDLEYVVKMIFKTFKDFA